MVDKVDMSLDDIIKQGKGQGGIGRKFGGRGRGGARGPARVSGGGVGPVRARRPSGNFRAPYTRDGGDIDGRWQHDMYDGVIPRGRGGFPPVAGGSAKLLVSNLDFGVSDTDVTELFQEFGPLKTAAIHYDRSGRSLGIADVVFERRVDAIKALKQYNGVPLDGRPMKIKLADEPASTYGGGGAGLRASGRIQPRPQQRQQSNFPRGRQGGAGGARGGRPNRRAAKSEVTAEELDAELDAYRKVKE